MIRHDLYSQSDMKTIYANPSKLSSLSLGFGAKIPHRGKTDVWNICRFINIVRKDICLIWKCGNSHINNKLFFVVVIYAPTCKLG